MTGPAGERKLNITPNFWTTHVGSVPHVDGADLSRRLVTLLDIPAWPQLPRRTFRENMYVQFSAGLPRIAIDEVSEKIVFDTSEDMAADLEEFYTRYLSEDVDAFAPAPDYAAGFYAMLDTIRATSGDWVKGQVIGPISFGLTVTDRSLRAGLYHELLADAIVKNSAMNARWQIRQLRESRPNVVIFVDEPYLASFGSAYISLGREQVIAMLDEVFEAIHAEGGLAGVHCCANTDWSVLLATRVDILNLDAYGYLENLALYPADLRAFLDRGGVIAWGIVPNDEAIDGDTAAQLADRLRQGMGHICARAGSRGIVIRPEELAARSLVTPRCGLGSTTVAVAERVFEKLAGVAMLLRQG
jgi:hypothetical protein